MKRLFSLMLTVSTTVIVNGQENGSDKTGLYGGSGGFTIGVKSQSVSQFDYFRPNTDEAFDKGVITIGGGGYTVFKGWIIGGKGFYRQGSSVTIQEGVLESYKYTITGGGGYLTFGKSIFNSTQFLLFPQVGIGFESIGIDKNLEDDILYNSTKELSSETNWFSPSIDLSVNFDYFPTFLNGAKIGLQAGFVFATERENNNWTHSGGKLINSDLPEGNFDGFYFSLTIGGGSLSKSN